MFQNISVKSADNKITKTNKPYKALEVQDESGAVFKTNIFSDFPDFANITGGSLVRAKLEQNGQYWNLVSETQGKPRGGASGGFKTAQAKEVVDYKDVKIGKRMDDKDFSIMTSSTMRDAVSLAIAEIKDITTLNTLEQDILKWRQWLLNNWEVDPKDVPPFN